MADVARKLADELHKLFPDYELDVNDHMDYVQMTVFSSDNFIERALIVGHVDGTWGWEYYKDEIGLSIGEATESDNTGISEDETNFRWIALEVKEAVSRLGF